MPYFRSFNPSLRLIRPHPREGATSQQLLTRSQAVSNTVTAPAWAIPSPPSLSFDCNDLGSRFWQAPQPTILAWSTPFMASARVNNFTDANFQQDVLNSDVPVVVDFWAEWCAPCKAIAPLIDQLAAQYEGKVRVGKLNIDDNQQVAQQFRIASIPTLIVFKGGKVVNQVIGANPQKIQSLFATAGT